MRLKVSMIVLIALMLGTVFLMGCGRVESYGAGISDRNVTSVSELLRNPGAYKGKTVTVKGKIVDECSTGCWFDLKDGAAAIYVNTELAQFAIPQKTGHEATVEGRFLVQDGKPRINGTGIETK
jgi:RNase P/RNase MRP subunit p29